jgi:hypothetical protein
MEACALREVPAMPSPRSPRTTVRLVNTFVGDPATGIRAEAGERPLGLFSATKVNVCGDLCRRERRRTGDGDSSSLEPMATAASSSEPVPQRLAAIRDQLTLLADYL